MFSLFLLNESSSEVYELQNVDILPAVCWIIQKFEVDQNFYVEIHVQLAMSLLIPDRFC